MMKRIIILVIIFLIITGCEDKNGELYLEFIPDTLTKDSLGYSIKNGTKSDCYDLYAFSLEKYENGKWDIVPKQSEFYITKEPEKVQSGSTKKASIIFSNIYGDLIKGKYRIKKSFSCDANPEKDLDLYLEFEIK